MNTRVGVDNPEEDYDGWNEGYYKFLCEFILANAERVNGKAPLIGFNMMWANPDDDIYKGDRQPGVNMLPLHKDWSDNLQRLFPGADGKFKTRVQYNAMTANVQKYLVGAQNQIDFMGKEYVDFILTPGTAAQYALDVQGVSQRHVYRDYTHMSYYGRIMAAHVWCAQLMKAFTGTQTVYASVDDILDGMPAYLKIDTYKDTPYPALNEEKGIYELSDNDKANILEAVNWALANPFTVPEN